MKGCRWLPIVVVSLLFVLTRQAKAENTEMLQAITASGAFIKAPAEARSTQLYLALSNSGDTPQRLTAATSPLAEHIELHRITSDHGLRRMHEVEDIIVPPHSNVVLKPGTYHLMLIDLKQNLSVGDKVPVELSFGKAGKLKLIVKVVEFRNSHKNETSQPETKTKNKGN